MSGILDALAAFAKSIFQAQPSSTVVATVGGDTVTAGDLVAAMGTISGYLLAVRDALQAKQYPIAAELTLDEALAVVKDTGLGGVPVALAATFVPMIFGAINSGAIPLGSLDDNAGEQQSEIAADRFGR